MTGTGTSDTGTSDAAADSAESRAVAPDVSARPIAQLWSLAGRRAVVTGGAAGIGAAIAERLVEAGADVLIGDIDASGATATATHLGDNRTPGRGRAAGHPLDVRDGASVAALADACVARFGGLDIWVNNAGVFPNGGLLSISETDWDDVIDVNLRGTWLGAREAARRMAGTGPDRQGVIVNLEAMAAHRGRVSSSHYVASKHGVVGLTRALAAELGPYGIRVVGVAPTLTETPGVARRRAAAVANASADGDREMVGFDAARPLRLEAALRGQAPLGRNAVPDDVARAVLFCVSDMAALVTGSSVFVDAGVLAP